MKLVLPPGAYTLVSGGEANIHLSENKSMLEGIYFLQLQEDMIRSLFSEAKSGDNVKDKVMEEKNGNGVTPSTNSFLLCHTVSMKPLANPKGTFLF